MVWRWRLGILLLVGTLGTPPVAAAPPQTLTVFAAASLSDALRDLGRRFEAAVPEAKLRFSFAGSQQLAQQIANGAPADVFASADEPQMRAAITSGRIDLTSLRPFARNRLVVATDRRKDAVRTLGDLAKPGTQVVLGARTVPVGRYSHEFLQQASRPEAFGPDFGRRVLGNVVSYELDVRSIVTKLALGEADAGLVYVSDLNGPQGAKLGQIAIPEAWNQDVLYPIATLADAPQRRLAQAFVDYVSSAEGQMVLSRHGLRVTDGARPYRRLGPAAR